VLARAEAPVPSSAAGRLAQLVERLPYKQEVACSSQAPPIDEKYLQNRRFWQPLLIH
jgi:hypothetical protein